MQKRHSNSGLIIYNLFPLLVGPTRAWAEHLTRIRAMDFDVVYINPFHLAGSSGSLYSIKDTGQLDPRFKNGPDDGDGVIAEFDEHARKCGLLVMIDLVINHAARDSVLVETSPELFAREPNGDLFTPWAADVMSETGKVFWRDLASFNYDDPAIRRRLIDHWDRYIARFQRLGIRAFRCDAAHMVPHQVWAELIERAKARSADCLFVGETLGCTLERAAEVARVGFDYIMSNFNYSDFRDLRALVEYEYLHKLAPSIAFPESHDTERFAARFEAGDGDLISRQLVSRYRLAAFFSTGVMMPMGYEWGYRNKIDVVKTTPRDREETGIDVSSQIAQVNRLRRTLPPLNIEGEQKRLSSPDDPVLLLLRGDDYDLRTSRIATLVAANTTSHPVHRSAAELFANAAPFGDFVDHTPEAEPRDLPPAAEFNLLPGEVRIFCGARGGDA